jgi:DNA-binding NarL/FixJ family response regulator
MIKILIADDHAVVREGLKQILSGCPDVIVADEACNGEEVLEKVYKGDFDLIILDITMPGKNGLDVLRELKIQRPELPVLMMSMYPEEQYAVRVLQIGASGYLTKESAPEELIKAIQQISIGKKYVSSSLAKIFASYFEID